MPHAPRLRLACCNTKGLLREAFCMSGIIIRARRAQLFPGRADNLVKMTMPNLPRTFAILLLPTLLAGCKLDDIPGLGPDPAPSPRRPRPRPLAGPAAMPCAGWRIATRSTPNRPRPWCSQAGRIWTSTCAPTRSRARLRSWARVTAAAATRKMCLPSLRQDAIAADPAGIRIRPQKAVAPSGGHGFFMQACGAAVSPRDARTPPCSPHGPCAGTC